MDRFDPFSADYLADPYPHLARARADAPVFPLADEARTTLREGGFRAGATMSNCDPPKHTRIRRHNLRAFSARRTAALEPRVRAAARSWSWCGNRMAFSWGRPSVAEQTAIAANMARYWRYCERFVADRIVAPRDDFTSDPVRVGVIYGLSFAGHETTTNLTTNTTRRGSPIRTPSTSTAPTPRGTWRSARASTSASARRSPGWSSASCWSCSPSTRRTSRWSPTRS